MLLSMMMAFFACLLFVVCCLLFVPRCLLFVVCCLLFVVCCLLFVVCCLLFVVCCLLFVVCCSWGLTNSLILCLFVRCDVGNVASRATEWWFSLNAKECDM